MSKQNASTPPANIYDPFQDVSENEKAVRYQRLLDDTKYLMGKVLTVVDASMSNEAQNKAAKDLIKDNFRAFLVRYENICYKGIQGSNPII